MIIKRQENWGTLEYDTLQHHLSFKADNPHITPYAQKPILLNLYLTMKCNLQCIHCVTKDFPMVEDFVVSKKVLKWINESPFMIVVITGGEPFLPDYQNNLLMLLKGIHRKGLIIDTNGTIAPSKPIIDSIIKTHTLVRISWDSVRPKDEICLRHIKSINSKNNDINLEYYYKKIEMIKWFSHQGINVAVQSVVHKKNLISITSMPSILQESSIKQWYLQRFIRAHKAIGNTFQLANGSYNKVVNTLLKECSNRNIQCIAKKDMRHNSVFMLTGNGIIYTQGHKPGQKIKIGEIGQDIKFFNYVSCSDHSERYYQI